MIVRMAEAADVPDILRLIRALAEYEREPDAVEATEAMLAERLFAPVPAVWAFVAELDGRVVGIAVWFLNFSTWTGRHGVYLEDLFVETEARGRGIARALFRALAREAVRRGCARLDWQVLDWNEDAKAAYRALGARHQAGWEPWRIDGDALAALAE
ncbi:GNAT family N-acetyltransferase [Sphingomonas jatrophae]|uniref:L-amino acid N-acyltransferase YncA n=1 Tax=Sphingomonas jatrophae TaxID=1166337 RepID=A0A1I6LRU8_9SPHN|nr:GNAT family N-acetyltransferase [Sphingomonas jatrophae]SFS06158.1 L-amino acid N-acyltransferase YncA [Sphingomonas jatrophae]